MNNSKDSVVLDCDSFKVTKIADIYGIEVSTEEVVVLPYLTDEGGMIERLGTLVLTSNGEHTIVRGPIRENDPDILGSAMHVMQETSGLNIREWTKWDFLGIVQFRGIINQTFPCYAVNATEDAGTDHSEKQAEGFSFLSIVDALNSEDALIQSAFLRLFRKRFEHNNL